MGRTELKKTLQTEDFKGGGGGRGGREKSQSAKALETPFGEEGREQSVLQDPMTALL